VVLARIAGELVDGSGGELLQQFKVKSVGGTGSVVLARIAGKSVDGSGGELLQQFK